MLVTRGDIMDYMKVVDSYDCETIQEIEEDPELWQCAKRSYARR